MARALSPTPFLLTAALAVTACSTKPGPERCDELGGCALDGAVPLSIREGDGGPCTHLRDMLADALRPMGMQHCINQPVAGSSVVVSAVDPTAGTVWVQEYLPLAAGGPELMACPVTPDGHFQVCGVQLFKPTNVPAGTHTTPGDLVEFTGIYTEFGCEPCRTHWPAGDTEPEVSSNINVSPAEPPTVHRIGSYHAPDPLPISLAMLTDYAHGRPYLNLVVDVHETNLVAANSPNAFHDFSVVGQSFLVLTTAVPSLEPTITNGTVIRHLRGVLTMTVIGGTVTYQVMPRNLSDIDLDPTTTRSGGDAG